MTRRRFFALVSIVSSLIFSVSGASAENPKPPKSISIGFIPGENPETLRENGAEIGRMLKDKLGIPVEIYVSKDYNGLIDAMKEKKIDFAFSRR